MAKFLLSFLLLALGLVHSAIAALEAYPEVIPAPGLPSLAELNLTSAGLHKRGMPDTKGKTTRLSGFLSTHHPMAFWVDPELRSRDKTALLARDPTLNRRYAGKCGPNNNSYSNVNNLISCFHYLFNLPSGIDCKTTRGSFGTSLVRAGDAQIAIFSQNDNQTSSLWQVQLSSGVTHLDLGSILAD